MATDDRYTIPGSGARSTPPRAAIRYLSRFQSHECWALFNGNVIGTVRTDPILPQDVELANVTREFGITLH